MLVLVMFTLAFIFNKQLSLVKESEILEMVQGREKVLLQRTPALGGDKAKMDKWREEQIASLIKQNGLDKPYLQRSVQNFARAITFQFGNSKSFTTAKGDKRVIAVLMERLPRTVLLFTTNAILVIVLSILLGIKKAQRPGGKLDKSTTILSLSLLGVPSWWLGMMVILIFSYGIQINGRSLLPPGGFRTAGMAGTVGYNEFLDILRHLILPLFTLVFLGIWSSAYIIRNVVIGILQEDFIMSARARGIPEKKILYSHTLRTALPPVFTMSFMGILTSFLAGAIIFEGIFNYQGIGLLYWEAIGKMDIPVLMGDLTLTTFISLGGYVFLDLIYGFLDPRIKVGGKA